MTTTDATTQPRDLVAVRVFDAPIEDVWRAWSDADLVRRWWEPNGFTTPLVRMDFRVGGTTLVCIRTPDGHDLYNAWAYQQIVPLERIEYLHHMADEHGRRIDPASIGMPEFPGEIRNVITFRSLDDRRTEMTVTEYGYTSDTLFDMSRAGLIEVLDKLAGVLAVR